MTPPLDGLTETDQLQIKVRTRDFENQLAAENAAIFDKETKMLQLDTARRQNEDARLNREAKQAYATSVLSKAQSPEEVDKLTRDFIAGNEQYAAYAPDLLSEGQKMFTSSAATKTQMLSLASAQRRDKLEQEIERDVIQERKAALSWSVMQNEDNVRKAKLEKLKASEDARDLIKGAVDVSDEASIEFGSWGVNQVDSALTEEDRNKVAKRISGVMQAMDGFKSVQRTLANDTALRFGDEINELQNDPEFNDSYQVWYESNKEQLKGMPVEGTFARFIGEVSRDSDNPDSLGYKIRTRGSNFAALTERARSMALARDNYNKFVSQVKKDKVTGNYDLGRAELMSQGLLTSMQEMQSTVEAQKKQAEKALDLKLKQSSVMRNEASARNLDTNTDQFNVLQKRYDSFARSIADIDKEIAKLQEAKKTGYTQAVQTLNETKKTLVSERDSAKTELESFKQRQSSNNPIDTQDTPVNIPTPEEVQPVN